MAKFVGVIFSTAAGGHMCMHEFWSGINKMSKTGVSSTEINNYFIAGNMHNK